MTRHYRKFRELMTVSQSWVGSDISKWWVQVVGNNSPKLDSLPYSRLTRDQLKEFCQEDSSDLECLGAIMAWGGQNRSHGRRLFSSPDEVVGVIHSLRAGELNRKAAYSAFYDLWLKGKSPGMGAAYFTKLIYFLLPNNDGYIMDQWTSKSINLILGRSLVDLNHGHVSKKNAADTYEKFCVEVERIASDLKMSAEDVEMAMFSKGGRNKEPWRNYVVEHFPAS